MDADASDPTAPDPDIDVTKASGLATDPVVELAWRRHRQWSLAASAARARLDRWRLRNLQLLVLGALAGAMAAQTWLASAAASGFAIAAAVALALAGFIQANALKGDQTARWIQARAASEALKAEVYRYLVQVLPYAGADRAKALATQLDAVQARVPQSLLVDPQTTAADDRPMPSMRTFEEYVTDRAQEQVNWHQRKSVVHAGQARTLRIWQLVATGVGVVLSAIAGFVPSWRLSTWTAAATTIAVALGTHLAATQHQRIASAYAATVDQLERLLAGVDPATATPGQQAQFVADVERVLVAQNNGWTDLLNPTAAAPEKTRPPKNTQQLGAKAAGYQSPPVARPSKGRSRLP